MPSLKESLELARRVKLDNPTLADLSDQDVADLVFRQTGDQRMLPAKESSALGRGISDVGDYFSKLGVSTEELIADDKSSFPVQVAGRAANNLVSSAPELALNMLAGRAKGLLRPAGFAGGAAFSYGRTKAETGDEKAALGSAGGSLLSLAGGIAGAGAGRKLAGSPDGLKGFAAGTIGSALGSVPGDALEIATAPGGFAEFLSDPLNVPAYVVGQGVVGAGLDAVTHYAETQAEKANQRKAATPPLDEVVNADEQKEWERLNKKPAHERSELDRAKLLDLGNRFAELDEKRLAQKLAKAKTVTAPELATLPETEATLRSQIYLLNKGKKSVVEIPKGQEIPQPRVPTKTADYAADYLEGYSSHVSPENGNLYLYDERKVTPEIIDSAIKTGTTGALLGYGTELPKQPTGKVAVLRSKKGTEKQAVILGDGNESKALEALRGMALEGDQVNVEPVESVVEWRIRNRGLKKLFSLAGEMTNPDSEISFTNHVLNMFEESLSPKQRAGNRMKGPRFQVDENAEISAKGLLQAVKDWSPASLWEHYKASGIETLLNFNKVEGTQITVQNYAPGRRMLQGDTIVNGKGIGSFDPQTESIIVPKDLPDGQYWYDANGNKFIPKAKDGKVKAAYFVKWLRENTPEVEIKKLIPKDAESEQARLQHELETLGWKASFDNAGELEGFTSLKDGHMRNIDSLPTRVQEIAEQLGRIEFDGRLSDAATGFYKVDPKELADMPGAVDILVRVPQKPGGKERVAELRKQYDLTAEQKRAEKGVLFRSNHFGDSDINVLASVRGYEETLPSGEKVFHVFEVQSDWGQKVSKQKEFVKDAKAGKHNQPVGHIEQALATGYNHPLLAHYESLALKTAIQHARSIGAKYIAISDSQTAMMTEGHDRHPRSRPGTYNLPLKNEISPTGGETLTGKVKIDDYYGYFYEAKREDGKTRWIEHNSLLRQSADEMAELVQLVNKHVPKYIDQESGMRAAYDERLPAIAERLTRSKPQKVAFGAHLKGDSPVFTRTDVNGQQVPKGNITARLYDISNPSAEVKKLFALYDADRQAEFEAALARELKNDDDGGITTVRAVLEKALAGKGGIEVDALVNFIKNIRGRVGTIREGTFLSPKIAGSLDLESRTVKLNKDITYTINRATRILSHEFTHAAIDDLRIKDPQTYEYLKKLVSEIGQPGREAILEQVKENVKLESSQFNPAYLSGKLFNPQDKFVVDRQTHEFVAGLVEAATEHFVQKSTNPEWFKYLPQPIVAVFSRVRNFLRQYFSGEFPSLSNILPPDQAHRLNSIVDVINKHVMAVEDANIRAVLNLKKSDIFNERAFVENLPSMRSDLSKNKGNISGELHSFASDLYDKTVGKVESTFENLFYSALFRTRTNPETARFFWALHNMRPEIQSEQYGYLANIGQLPDGSLSREQALERYGKFISSITNPFNKRGKTLLDTFSRVIEENQNRREKLNSEKKEVQSSDLVSLQDMTDTYKLTKEEAFFLQKIIELPEVVMNEVHRKAEITDSHYIAKIFYRANKSQDTNGVVEKVQRLNRIANDFGVKRFELDVYKRRLAQENRSPNPDLEMQGIMGENIRTLEAEQEAFKVLFDQQIRAEFGGAIMFKPGPDPFVSQVMELMVRMAALRANNRFMTKDVGYAPMTRRGRFLLRVYENSELGEEFAKVKEFKGFDTEKAAREYIASQQLSDADFELIDKEELRGRVQAFSPDRLKSVRDRAKEHLGELVTAISRNLDGIDPAQQEALLSVLHDLESQFRPLEDEIKDVLAVRGDKFKERRYLVKGFDRNDFLPNIFEYMNYKSVASNKQLTRARAELELERGELDNNLELRTRMEKELNYVLSNQSEFNGLRKAVFYYYLGASFRHVIQNAVQIPLNGVSQMVASGHGFRSYAHFSKAGVLASKYSRLGTTGDATLDILLKQAEKDGVSFQTALEAPIQHSIEIQNALDSLNAQSEGSLHFGEKIPYLATQAVKSFEKFLQSTSAAAESANRKTTFIAAVLAERAKGVSDAKTLYAHATEFTNYVNFVGDKPNRPGYLVDTGGTVAHGPLVLWSALQSFTINHVSQLYSFYKKGFHQGSVADKKAFAVGLAHLLAFSGSMGFVGAATAEQLFEEVTGISLKTALRNKLVETLPFEAGTVDRIADTVLHGLPALAGVDMSGSVGLGSPLIRYQAGQPLTIEQFGGAAVGMLGRVGQAVGEVSQDPFNPQQWWSAGRNAAPAFLSQAIRVYDVLNAGTVLDSKQQPVSDPLSSEGSAAAVLGFTPMEVSKQRTYNSEVYKSTKKMGENYELAVRNIAKSLDEHERTGNPDALIKANEMFSNYLNSVGGMQNREAMADSITTQLQEFRGRVTKPASLKESAERRRINSAFPSVKDRYSSDLSTLFDELGVLQSLGQDDLLLRKLESIPSSSLDAVLTDLLVELGLTPAEAGLVKQPSRAAPLGRGTNPR